MRSDKEMIQNCAPNNSDCSAAPRRRPRRGLAVAAAIALLVALVVASLCLARARRYVTAAPNPRARRARLTTYPFRTGDLVITSNRNGRNGAGIESLLDWSAPIKWFTGSTFNHTAVAYVEPDTKQVLFWEINGTGTRLATVRDLTCGRPDHDIFVRSLSAPVDDVLFEGAMAAQWEHEFNFFVPAAVCARMLGRPRGDFYASSLLGLSECGALQRRATASRRTCAHMTAELYHLVGVLDYDEGRSGIDPAALSAGDFAKSALDTRILPLADGYHFGPLVHLC